MLSTSLMVCSSAVIVVAEQSVWMLLVEMAVHCTEGVTWEFLQRQWERALVADSTPHGARCDSLLLY